MPLGRPALPYCTGESAILSARDNYMQLAGRADLTAGPATELPTRAAEAGQGGETAPAHVSTDTGSAAPGQPPQRSVDCVHAMERNVELLEQSLGPTHPQVSCQLLFMPHLSCAARLGWICREIASVLEQTLPCRY